MKIQASPIFQWLEDNKDKRQLFLYGGAGSGKSTAVALYLIKKMFNERNISILVTRRTSPSMRMTIYKIFLDLLERYFEGKYTLNKTEMIITIGSNDCQFKSLDDESKIRSLSVSYIFCEECSELSLSQYEQLRLRLRKNGSNTNQLIMATNPISIFSWPYQNIYLNPDPNIAKHHSTYLMNPFLSPEYVKDLLELKGNNRTVYLEGAWGKMEGLIFTGYEVVDTIFDTVKSIQYGLDFGFTVETALSKIYVLEDGKFYAEELLYEKGLTNQELIRRLEKLIPDKSIPIWCDSAEPNRIREIAEAGYWACKSNKDVSAGIDHMIENMIGVKSNSVNLIRELSTYSWALDSMDRVTPKPIKQYDHLIDSIRMACFSSRGNKRVSCNVWEGRGYGGWR